jgi:predicted transcriptional regulator
MRKSKLESYEDILEVLVNEPLAFEQIAHRVNMEPSLLRQRLDFLMKNNLIEERPSDKKISYAITERGTAVLRALNFQKYLGKIKDKIRAIDEALQVIPDISERTRNLDEKNTN